MENEINNVEELNNIIQPINKKDEYKASRVLYILQVPLFKD